jgi:hypothetical protein
MNGVMEDNECNDYIIPKFIDDAMYHILRSPNTINDNDLSVLSLSSIGFIIPALFAVSYNCIWLGAFNTLFAFTYVNYWNRPWCCVTEQFFYAITSVSIGTYISLFIMAPVHFIQIVPLILVSSFCLYEKGVCAEQNNTKEWLKYTQYLYLLFISFQILCIHILYYVESQE